MKLWHEVPSSTGLLPLRLFIQKTQSFNASNQTSEDFNFLIASSFFFISDSTPAAVTTMGQGFGGEGREQVCDFLVQRRPDSVFYVMFSNLNEIFFL